MRVLLWSNHVYPSGGRSGTGFLPNRLATGGACFVHDKLAKGLSELGHEVFYRLKAVEGALPDGVIPVLPDDGMKGVSTPGAPDVDIIHHCNSHRVDDEDFRAYIKVARQPWITTCHADPRRWGVTGDVPDNWIFVSETLARSCGKSRYILNGIDPAEYEYSEVKDDYFLFMCNFRNLHEKGLALALELSQSLGLRLVVAGPCAGATCTVDEVRDNCERAGAGYIGDVRGKRKADLLAGARALLFPTEVNEGFGLVVAEALMSGTPVICSDRGACPEIVSPDVGFVCRTAADYAKAIMSLDSISAQACRRKALEKYHYLVMARNYVREYESQIDSQFRGGE